MLIICSIVCSVADSHGNPSFIFTDKKKRREIKISSAAVVVSVSVDLLFWPENVNS